MSIRSSQIVWLGVGELLNRGAVFGLFFFAVAWLDKASLANYLVLFSFANICWSGAQLGTGMHGIRRLATIDDAIVRRVKAMEVVALRLVITPIIAVIAGVVAIQLFDATLGAGILVAVLVFARAPQVDWILRALSDYSRLAIISVIAACLSLLIGYFVIRSGRSVDAMLFSHIIPLAIVAIGSWMAVLRVWSPRSLLQVVGRLHPLSELGGAATIGICGFLALVTQALPLFWLRLMSELEAAAEFGSVLRIIQAALGVVTVLSFVHYPALTRSLRSPQASLLSAFDRYLADLVTMSCLFLIVVFALDNLIADWLKIDDRATRVLLAFACAAPAYFIRSSLSDLQIATGGARDLLNIFLLALIVSVVLCALLLPAADNLFRAAALAAIVGEYVVISQLAVKLSKDPDMAWIRPRIVGVIIFVIVLLVTSLGLMYQTSDDITKFLKLAVTIAAVSGFVLSVRRGTIGGWLSGGQQ